MKTLGILNSGGRIVVESILKGSVITTSRTYYDENNRNIKDVHGKTFDKVYNKASRVVKYNGDRLLDEGSIPHMVENVKIREIYYFDRKNVAQ